ncbi:hypothetical protein DEO72_LG10g3540 [Vigna unguiculata]|uniref:Uncharacterized protein n=1 Tax=Vigna unguiculata TaxID=3917 RepID=A0A4D6NG20_VIGUN|nr:hypothetical protein DEO72_LG10g3540 [Vigna unguiculata]
MADKKAVVLTWSRSRNRLFTSARVPTFIRFTFHLSHSSAHLASRVLELLCPLFQCRSPVQTHFQVKTVAGSDKLAKKAVVLTWSRSRNRLFTSARVPTFIRFTFHLSHSSAHLASRVLELLCPLFQCRSPVQTHFQARGVSPKRDPASASAPFSSPRLGEGGARLGETISPERGAGRDSARHDNDMIGGETFRDALQWSGRNSMALLVGVYGGASSLRIEQLEVEQRYPPQVQASAESDQVIRIWMS